MVNSEEQRVDYQIKSVKRTGSYSPNILAVVNFPKNHLQVPIRGYILDIGFQEAYNGDINLAAEHFIERTKKIVNPADGELEYILGFIKGKSWKKNGAKESRVDRDIVYLPFEKSDNFGRAKSRAFMVKSQIQDGIGAGVMTTVTPYKIEDIFILVANEILYRRKNSLENFSEVCPEIEGIE